MKKHTAIFFFIIVISITLFCCTQEGKTNYSSATESSPTFGKGVKTDLGTTGFTIELPPTHKIEEGKGADFVVYYITSYDSLINKGEAGFFFGPTPDQHGPPNIVSKEESAGMQLGKPSKSVKYITPKYTWIETVIEEGDSTKIQTWYFAYDNAELSKLEKMVNTIARR